MTIQQQFADRITAIIKKDPSIIGLAVGGSWLSNEIDEYSDLDLVLVSKGKISGDKQKMLAYAKSFGDLLSGFTGEHVGEPRVLICLYDNPLLHVDIKFLTLEEFSTRIETPVILADTNDQLQQVLNTSTAKFPYPSFQWIEDRFWVWVHYILQKTGRGEYLEAFDCFGLLRMMVLGPLMHIKNNNLPRGVRKVESQLPDADLEQLKLTIPSYDRQSLIVTLENSIALYRSLREKVFDNNVVLQSATEKRVMQYLHEMKNK
jgi:predicted nucleotidyltransferase